VYDDEVDHSAEILLSQPPSWLTASMKRSCISVVHRLRILVLWGEWTFVVAGGETVGYKCPGIVGTETN
jgi:hypothetical protein